VVLSHTTTSDDADSICLTQWLTPPSVLTIIKIGSFGDGLGKQRRVALVDLLGFFQALLNPNSCHRAHPLFSPATTTYPWQREIQTFFNNAKTNRLSALRILRKAGTA